jgi:hypothetical protein
LRQSPIGNLIVRITLPLLAALNATDALLSFHLFRIYGIGIERNPVIAYLLNLDDSMFLFLGLKLGGSVFLLAYWLTAKKIRAWIHILTTFGVAVYLIYFGRELPTIVKMLSIQN